MLLTRALFVRLSQVASVLALGIKPHVRKKWSKTKKYSLRTSYLKLVTLALMSTPPNMPVSDTKAALICDNEASDMNHWSTSVVVVPGGPPVRCLRRDMVTDSVFEVWVMVSRAISTTTLTHEVEEGRGGQFLISPQSRPWSPWWQQRHHI